MRRSGLFTSLEGSTLKLSIAERLTEAIFSNQLKPGERLNESQLSREFGVSRAPIREALQQLWEQGLVVNSPHRGMFVVRLEDQDIQKINSLRLIVEAEALRLCRAHITPAGENKLKRLVKRMEQTQEAGWVELWRLDFEFHRTIWSFSGNQFLERFLTNLISPLMAYYTITYVRTDEPTESTAEAHRLLLEYVQGKFEMPAEKLLLKHLRGGWDRPERFSSLALAPEGQDLALPYQRFKVAGDKHA